MARIHRNQYVIKSPVMNCCGLPRSQCRCGALILNGQVIPTIGVDPPLTMEPTLTFNYGHGVAPPNDPLFPFAIQNAKAEGSNADSGMGSGMPGTDAQYDGYWVPKKGSGSLGKSDDDLDEENRRRLGLGTESEITDTPYRIPRAGSRGTVGKAEYGDDDVLPPPQTVKQIVDEDRKSKTAELRRGKRSSDAPPIAKGGYLGHDQGDAGRGLSR